MAQSSRMDGKVCIVTGSSSGIGQAVAVMLASRGASVTLCGRDETRLGVARGECVEASGGHTDRFLIVKGDITDSVHRKEIVKKTVDKFGGLDVLVANAGVALKGDTLDEITEEQFDILINTNMKSVLFLIKEAKPHLVERKGNVVVVSSCGSMFAFFVNLTYAMTKAGLDHLVRCLTPELGAKGVRINGINPSFIETRGTRGSGDPDIVNKMVAQVETPFQLLEKRIGTLQEIAEAICFLASPAASFITGENFKADGGRTLAGTYIS